MDAFVEWFRETLALRYACARAANGEPDFERFVEARDAYFERHPQSGRPPTFADRDEDDDISFLAPNLESLACAAFFAALRHPGDRFTAITSTETDFGTGLAPAVRYAVERVDGLFVVVGEGGLGDDSPYGVDHAQLPVTDVIYLDGDRLAPRAADFVGSIEVVANE